MPEPISAIELLQQATYLRDAGAILAEQAQEMLTISREMLTTAQELQEAAAGVRVWPAEAEVPED